ncbi:flagellar biosynthesis anti-sigma factor FlgM [Pseudomonas sp. UL073]|uniref:Negative regulator of flagellin synthesis n=1 Tax=Zestomonas insulae TaxID=2809017 RepID=A0ABS2IA67_9GAMM|nr:flagellar biosynthesis anti-sigma factor FlgM [Pseudomonas insulae]MBM7059144.1 flagellar biosynthesis anti-sigma factor FlgM [Pseudomonas insulae]
MEINRQFKAGYTAQSEVQGPAKSERLQQSQPAPAAVAPVSASEELPLEQLQEALRKLPEVDLDKVAALKLALQRGDLLTDSTALAGSMLDYHGGKPA